MDDLDEGTRARQRTIPDFDVICTMSVHQGLSFGIIPDILRLNPVLYRTVPRPGIRITIRHRQTVGLPLCHIPTYGSSIRYRTIYGTVPYGTSSGWSDRHRQTVGLPLFLIQYLLTAPAYGTVPYGTVP